MKDHYSNFLQHHNTDKVIVLCQMKQLVDGHKFLSEFFEAYNYQSELAEMRLRLQKVRMLKNQNHIHFAFH